MEPEHDERVERHAHSRALGLWLAVEECQRLRSQAISRNYKEAYVAALDEALTMLKAMHARAVNGKCPHPTTSL